jgi:hypothetical protein
MQRIAEKFLQTISKTLSGNMEAPAKGVRFLLWGGWYEDIPF